MLSYLKKISFLLLIVAGIAGTASAQVGGIGDVSNNVSLSILPAAPLPGGSATVTVTSYLLDLDRANFTWFLNGVKKTNAVGAKQFSFTTAKAGGITTVGVSIQTADGATISKSISIQPAEVNLAFEANSTVHPFYKGKALFPSQGVIKFVALPNLVDQSGNAISSNKLIYKWTLNREIQGSLSGFGKDTFSYVGTILGESLDVKVEASSLDGSQIAQTELVVSPIQPRVLLYENNPLFGVMYEKALSDGFSFIGGDVKILATPFYFNKNALLSYLWTLNGDILQNEQGANINLHQGGEAGTSAISLEVSDGSKLLLKATTGISIELTPK